MHKLNWMLFALLAGSVTNAAALSFTETTPSVADVSSGNVDWVDFDVDGDLDLFVMGYPAGAPPVSRLYRNNGGTFTIFPTTILNLGLGAADWKDIDGDGDPDLAICGRDATGFSRTRVYRNDGGDFVELDHAFLDVYAGTVSWYDEDFDGDVDLLVTGIGDTHHTGYYINEGQGNFTTLALIETGIAYGEVHTIDFNVDGRADLGYLGRLESEDPDVQWGYVFSLDEGVGGLEYQSLDSFPGLAFGDFAWGDLDNDGDLDVASLGRTEQNENLTEVRLRTPSGFVTQLLSSRADGSLDLGDADNDGDLDLVYGGINSVGTRSMSVYENRGGAFTFSVSLAPVAQSDCAWGDYDGDGDLDLALTGQFANGQTEFYLYRNDSVLANNAPAVPEGSTAVAKANSVDFRWLAGSDLETPAPGLHYNVRVGSSPGSDDIVPSNSAPDGTRRVRGFGNAVNAGGFGLDPRRLPGGWLYWNVQSLDAAGAGSAFTAEQSLYLPFVRVWDESTLGNWDSASCDWGDMDDDGVMEAVVAGRRVNSNGSGVSRAEVLDPVAGVPTERLSYSNGTPQWGDFDGDNDLDLVLTSTSDMIELQLFRNDGDSLVVVEGSMLPSTNGGTVEWGDLDRDGDLDLLFSEFGIYRNDGGVFDPLGGVDGALDGYATLGDFDLDGDLDVLQGGIFAEGTEHRILRNDDGVWTPLGDGLTAGAPCAGSFVDHDGDGDLDVVVAGGDGPSQVLRNDAGVFVEDSAASSGLPAMGRAKILVLDLTNDGDEDLVFTGQPLLGTETTAMENVGGSFTVADVGLPLHLDRGAVGDFEGDGDLDLLLVGGDSAAGGAEICRNNHDSNLAPLPPQGLGHAVDGEELILYWMPGSDAESPRHQLTYNVRVGTTPGGSEIVTPMAHPSGRRKVSRPGATRNSVLFRLKLADVNDPVLYWSVQTIDGSRAGSAFASEQTVALDATGVESVPPGRLGFVSVGPNPTASTSKLVFRTPQDGAVRLQVFDLRGRAVRILYDGWLDGGSHALSWDGRDGRGRSVAAGAYFLRLESGGDRRLRKIQILR